VEPSGSSVGLDDFLLLRVIGRGSYAKVFVVEQKTTKRVYAMKVIKKELVNDDEVQPTHCCCYRVVQKTTVTDVLQGSVVVCFSDDVITDLLLNPVVKMWKIGSAFDIVIECECVIRHSGCQFIVPPSSCSYNNKTTTISYSMTIFTAHAHLVTPVFCHRNVTYCLHFCCLFRRPVCVCVWSLCLCVWSVCVTVCVWSVCVCRTLIGCRQRSTCLKWRLITHSLSVYIPASKLQAGLCRCQHGCHF